MLGVLCTEPGRSTNVAEKHETCAVLPAGMATKRLLLAHEEAVHRELHMRKALMEMNLQLHHVVSDITGATCMRIIRAIVAGKRDPDVLASSLVRNDRDEHIFALTQSLDLCDFYQAQVAECDRKLEAAIAALTVRASAPIAALPKVRVKAKQVNEPSFDVRAALYGVIGVNLTQIHGLGPSLVLKLIGECGTDLSAWPSAKHFASWLCLAPGN
ncbi:IS110 family transposase [Mesorhizobium sp. M0166]|uniref:transposase n=1 Tax=Mesorhizobium sp. M0166 TaxID=2956902 RepID=UPI00333A3F70